MAFTSVRLDSQLWAYFTFYATGGANGGIFENLTGGEITNQYFKITEVRLTLSVVFASVEDFIIKISEAINGSAYNHTFISKAVNGIINYRWVPDHVPTVIVSGDTLGFAMSMKSAINIWGLEVHGWAVASNK